MLQVLPASALALALVAASATRAHAQFDYDACGTLIQGVTCVLYEDDATGEQYLLDDIGGFGVGEFVHVMGTLTPSCITICLQGDGCIFDNTIELCMPPPELTFVRGDVNGDTDVNALLDALYLLTFAFGAGPPPPCEAAADVDDNGTANALIDALYLLTFSFSGGPEPPPPYPACGEDTTGDMIACDTPGACP